MLYCRLRFQQTIIFETAMNTIHLPEDCARVLDAHEDYQVIRRFVPRDVYCEARPAVVQRGLIVDTETTGKDPKVDKLVELGMILFEYCPETGRALRILDTFCGLEDPGMPIHPDASKVSGITDEMVKGQKLSDDTINSFVMDADIVIAHNASFDRVILEKRLPVFAHMPWVCSQHQVDWQAEGISSQKLDYIAYRMKFFYQAHRADIDCRALLEALQRPLPVTQGLGLKQLLDAVGTCERRIWALDSRFEIKDVLKARGYRWNDGSDGTDKAWWIEVPGDEFEAELEWLKANVYANRRFRVSVATIDAQNRYSQRLAAERNIIFHG